MKNLLFTLFVLLHFAAFTQSCPGLTFYTQTEIDDFPVNYPNCTEMEEFLIINGESLNDPITNLDGLYQLISIIGVLAINNFEEGSTLDVSGLNNIISVSVFNTNDCPGITDFGLVNLEVCSQGLWITNSGLSNFTTFTSLQQASEIHLYSNPYLTDLAGLENLINIEGHSVEILNNPSLVSVADLKFQTINYTLWIKDNENLTSIDLNNLNSVNTLNIVNNASLNDLSGLENLNSVNSLRIAGNNALVSLDGLQNIFPLSIQSLTITDNESLSNCSVQSICDYLLSVNEYAYIINNDEGCNSEDEIIENCEMNLSISGVLLNVTLKLTNGEYDYLPEENYVNAYSESDPYADPLEIYTMPIGIFNFETNIDPEDTYRVSTYFEQNYWGQTDLEAEYEFNKNETQPGTNDIKIYIPQRLFESVNAKNKDLVELEYQPLSNIAQYSYRVEFLGNGSNEYPAENFYHTMARNLIADQLVLQLDQNAKEIVKSEAEMLAAMLDVIYKTFNKAKVEGYNEKINEMKIKHINYILDRLDLTSAIESQFSKFIIDSDRKALIIKAFTDGHQKILEEFFKGAGLEAAKAAGEVLFMQVYKFLVNESVGNSDFLQNRINNLDFEYTTKDAFDTVLRVSILKPSIYYQNTINTTETIVEAEFYKMTQEDFGIIADWLDLLGSSGWWVSAKLSLYSKILKGLNFFGQAYALAIVMKQGYDTYDDAYRGAYLSFDPFYIFDEDNKNTLQEPQGLYDLTQLEKYKNEFGFIKEQTEIILDSILYFVNNQNRDLAIGKIYQYNALDDEMDEAIFLYKAPIIAKSENAYQQIATFDSIYTELRTQEHYFYCDRLSSMAWMINYLEDEDFESDTLGLSMDTLKLSLNSLDSKINQCLQLLDTVYAPAFVAVTDHDVIEDDIVPDEPFTIQATVQNIGTFYADSIFLKLNINSNVSFITDSIISIGTLQAGEEKNVEWVLEYSDQQLSFINYSIVIDSTTAATHQASSVIFVSNYYIGIDENERSNYKMLEFYPNPNNGTIHINSHNLPEGMMEFELIDLMGKVVYQQSLRNLKDSPELIIELNSNIQEGLYFMRATIENQIYTNKIIIQ